MSASDTRYMSKEFITEFINIYQNHPCLWQVQSKDYMNTNFKNKAYEKLLEFCKKTVPDANREFVTKKIQNLRAAFRKKVKKVESSKRSGSSTADVYEPTLWYYGLLSFTLNSETAVESIDNVSINSPDSEIIAEIDDNTSENVLNHDYEGQDMDGNSQKSVNIS
ncbi:hypothetical protein NQ314_017125 [Rhamnusium bicolor]|uniref:MADF domain-containing protein n=1 Tax=Rhamnusium bicolor TaxID=1586634 RepID=A0AAV8WTN5_9CUCU|nr:hypothetical protein NQ314_017125 [Rhamnusium bicolor]